MGNFGILVLLVIAACKPLYGDKPQQLRNPVPVPHSTALPGDEAKVIYDDDCELVVSRGQTVKREKSAATEHVDKGDAKLRIADKAPPEAKTDLIVDGIDEYSAALRKDPFNAQATLKLALAYDKVLRKGCALALLQRLDQLAQNPKFKQEAEVAIDEIEQQRKWFEGYRKQALRSIGRTSP